MTTSKTSTKADRPATQRRRWSPPRVVQLHAGKAELGANPVNPEGLALGS